MRGLTVVNAELERAECQTPPGMAFWSGTGPEGAKCGKCAHFGYSYPSGISPTNGETLYSRKISSCEKFFQMSKRHGASLRKTQDGCKYFEAAKP